jgi:hypothetical protein
MTRAAAVCSVVLGLGFGLPGVYGTWYFARHHEVWNFLGFPTYGDGPFDRWGLDTSTTLLAAFVLVCAAELAVGVMLWDGSATALWLAMALLPFEVAFWVGFALPFGFLLGLARTVLAVLALTRV